MNEKWTDSSFPRLLLCLLLALALWACPKPAMEKIEDDSAVSAGEAERTRKMEEKAAEIHRMEEEIRTMEGSDQDKIDAVNRLDEARRELTALEEDGDGGQ